MSDHYELRADPRNPKKKRRFCLEQTGILCEPALFVSALGAPCFASDPSPLLLSSSPPLLLSHLLLCPPTPPIPTCPPPLRSRTLGFYPFLTGVGGPVPPHRDESAGILVGVAADFFVFFGTVFNRAIRPVLMTVTLSRPPTLPELHLSLCFLHTPP